MEGLRSILSQPYFRRCWVLQEVTLGRDVELCFGDVAFAHEVLFEWFDLVVNIETWCQHHRKLCQDIFRCTDNIHIVCSAKWALADGDELPLLEISIDIPAT